MSRSLFNKIPEIIDRFDFDKVDKVMTFLNWTWAAGSVPTIDELKATAYVCLDTAVLEYEKMGRPARGMNVSTGGFEATINVFESGTEELQLLFYVDAKRAGYTGNEKPLG